MSKKTTFQFQKELNIPIYLSLDLLDFDGHIAEFLTNMKFSKLSDKEEVLALSELKKKNHARILHLSIASPLVAKQINGVHESDRYGGESVTQKEGYRLYRYKNTGMMIYSLGAKEWQLGCYKDFGTSKSLVSGRMMINRYLTWALVSYGFLGIWGVTIDDGIVAQKPNDSRGEVVFVDIILGRMISVDGIKKLKPHFKILRLDPILKGKNIKMKEEELLSFLSSHCSYLDLSGLSIPVRQMIQTLSKMTEGLIHPKESFRPRIDLSL